MSGNLTARVKESVVVVNIYSILTLQKYFNFYPQLTFINAMQFLSATVCTTNGIKAKTCYTLLK